MNALNKIISRQELLPYLIIGAIATLIDWSAYSFVVTRLHLHYELSLLIGYVSGGIFHYITNKLITFKCHSKQLGSQLIIYTMVGTTSLLMSMAILAVLIKGFVLQKVLARIITTGIMILPNYLLHKHITFSKKIFTQPA